MDRLLPNGYYNNGLMASGCFYCKLAGVANANNGMCYFDRLYAILISTPLIFM